MRAYALLPLQGAASGVDSRAQYKLYFWEIHFIICRASALFIPAGGLLLVLLFLLAFSFIFK